MPRDINCPKGDHHKHATQNQFLKYFFTAFFNNYIVMVKFFKLIFAYFYLRALEYKFKKIKYT
jgi:hypothetical protein